MFDKMRDANLEMPCNRKIKLEVDQNGAFNYEMDGGKEKYTKSDCI